MKIKLDPGAYMPERAHEYDAGLDMKSPVDALISPGYGIVIDTGVHMEIPEGYVGLIKSRGGLNIGSGIQCEGVIDSHYTGGIRIKLYNNGFEKYSIKAGDKIGQLLVVPVLLPGLEFVSSLEETDRGDNGFGSTGR